jgi:hypothetical protein
MCCILGGCDYFKLKGVALKNAMKAFMNSRTREPEDWLVELLPNMPGLARVFSELMAMKKLSSDKQTAAKVIEKFLLADGAFRCPLVVNLPLPDTNPNKPLYVSLFPLKNLVSEQGKVVQENLKHVCGDRPLDPAEEWRIATAAAAAAAAATSAAAAPAASSVSAVAATSTAPAASSASAVAVAASSASASAASSASAVAVAASSASASAVAVAVRGRQLTRQPDAQQSV